MEQKSRESDLTRSAEPQEEVNEEFVTILTSMGFSRPIAERALRESKNDLDLAASLVVDLTEWSAGQSSSDESTDDVETLKMVFVVNASLNMTTGKTAAQVAHGALGLYRELMNNAANFRNVATWQEIGERKIVLVCDSEEILLDLEKRSKVLNIPNVLIRDSGLTEVEYGSATVLALFGFNSKVDQITGELRLLK